MKPINKITYKEDMDFKSICLYETGKEAVSERIMSLDITLHRILNE